MSVTANWAKSKCVGFGCEIKNTCFRFLAKSFGDQMYLHPKEDDDGNCLDYWKLKESEVLEFKKEKE